MHEGTSRLHVYYIKGKIIEGSPFSAATNDNQHAPVRFKFNSINRYCQQKYRFKSSLEEDFLVTSLALDKELLTNQDQVIMPSVSVDQHSVILPRM